jgi:hypothetical protein
MTLTLLASLAFLATLLVAARWPAPVRAIARDPGPIRPAGPERMRDPPRRWDEVDETSDESFPASDAPARY